MESSCQQSCNCHVMVLGQGGKVMMVERGEEEEERGMGQRDKRVKDGERARGGGRGVCLTGLESV